MIRYYTVLTLPVLLLWVVKSIRRTVLFGILLEQDNFEIQIDNKIRQHQGRVYFGVAFSYINI